mgnify:CR=1 FL=1
MGGPPPGAATLEALDACAWFGDRLVLEGVDLVMRGGITSGIVYPRAVAKLANDDYSDTAEAIASSWNATVTQSGRQVTAVNASLAFLPPPTSITL